MTTWQALILAVIEGITEFLPVSSTGHLVLASWLMGIGTDEFTKSYLIVIQLGALLSVLFLYGSTIMKNPRLLVPVFLAFIPSALAGFAGYATIKGNWLENPSVTAASLLLGGIVLLFADKIQRSTHSLTSLSWKRAVLIGMFQSLSVIPGVSRSAASIIGAMAAGLSKKDAVIFSFLLAAPTITAATAYDLMQGGWTILMSAPLTLAGGMLIACITAILSMKTFLDFVSRKGLWVFGWYRIILSTAYYFFVRYKARVRAQVR